MDLEISVLAASYFFKEQGLPDRKMSWFLEPFLKYFQVYLMKNLLQIVIERKCQGDDERIGLVGESVALSTQLKKKGRIDGLLPSKATLPAFFGGGLDSSNL